MNNKYYRISCNKIGIYEYLKRNLLCNRLEKEWKEFINSKKVNWLKKPLIYSEGLKKYYSYFTEKGYEMFNAKTLPLITKWIDLNLIVVQIGKINKEKIVYSDEYQIVVESKTKFNILFDEFYGYIYNQKKFLNYKLEKANYKDLERIKKYKLATIFEYAKNLEEQEINRINNYINIEVTKQINDYKNIIYNGIVIGSVLVRSIDDGLLIDEIFIENEYRNKGIGTSVIKNILSNRNKNIYLWVYKDNIKAIKLYKKLGFTILEKTDSRYYMINKL